VSKNIHGQQHGIGLQKKYGQHFLRDQLIVDHMIGRVELTPTTSVLEIGCGDGFLTRSILQQSLERLWIFEIDHEWIAYVRNAYPDSRMTIFEDNILDTDFTRLQLYQPWTLLSNLPYQITFPLLHLLQRNRELFKEGVIMVQEEVAQKIVATHGRGYGYSSLFFQHYFQWELLDKIPPTAFYPPPKVYSRLLYFKPVIVPDIIIDEDKFWHFIKQCFQQPRRTLKNNLAHLGSRLSLISADILALRAQQMSKKQFVELWNLIHISRSA
jgi:16S rRNA (adenine1518-N6/adenine1519-N6)-dimethyltransferase